MKASKDTDFETQNTIDDLMNLEMKAMKSIGSHSGGVEGGGESRRGSILVTQQQPQPQQIQKYDSTENRLSQHLGANIGGEEDIYFDSIETAELALKHKYEGGRSVQSDGGRSVGSTPGGGGGVVGGETYQPESQYETGNSPIGGNSNNSSNYRYHASSHLSHVSHLELPQIVEKANEAKVAIEIDYNTLTFEKKLGEGRFGIVWKGLWVNEMIAIKEFKYENVFNVIEDAMDGTDGTDYTTDGKGDGKGDSKGDSKGDGKGDGKTDEYENDDTEKNKEKKKNMESEEMINEKKRQIKELTSELILCSSVPFHPNLMRILGYTKPPKICVIMPFLEGGSAEHYVYKSKRKS